jgi:hypothetical protein
MLRFRRFRSRRDAVRLARALASLEGHGRPERPARRRAGRLLLDVRSSAG